MSFKEAVIVSTARTPIGRPTGSDPLISPVGKADTFL